MSVHQAHRFLVPRCELDVLDALALLMTHHSNATRANVSCARLRQASTLLLNLVRSVSVSCVLRLRQVILALIRIPHVVWCHRAKHISSSALAAHDFDVTFGGSWRTVLTRLFCGASEQLVSKDAPQKKHLPTFRQVFLEAGDVFIFQKNFRWTALPPDR